MPIVAFQNRLKNPLSLVIEPMSERYDVPPLATVGIRYALPQGAEDRSTSVVSHGEIEFWCNATNVDVEVVPYSPAETLLHDICVNGGWCGGIVNGKPTHVEDLLPRTGIVTAREFARLAAKADGWADAEPVPDDHLDWLASRFIENLGADSMPAEELQKRSHRPFDDA